MAQVVAAAECVLVSPGVTAAEARRLGFRHAATVQEALDAAFARLGRGASVAVLKHGGRLLPLSEGEARGDV